MKARMLGAVALAALVAACGTQPEERVTGGAAAGAATGAGVGALGGPVGALAGAGIGAAAGATTGAVTEPSTLNLGEPPWSNPEARVPGVDGQGGGGSSRSAATSDPRTRQLQQALNDRGFDAGPVDGIYGPRTRQAVMSWQQANGMEATGRPSQQMLSDLNIRSTGTAGAQSDRDRAYMGGGMAVGEQDRRTGTTTGTGASGGSMGGGSTGGDGRTRTGEPTGSITQGTGPVRGNPTGDVGANPRGTPDDQPRTGSPALAPPPGGGTLR